MLPIHFGQIRSPADWVTRTTFVALVLSSMSSCAVSSVGAESRAHGEESVLHKLLSKDDSFETVFNTAVKRGYQCNDETNDGRSVTCQKQMDLKVFGCKWYVHIFKAKSLRGEVFDISSYQACN